ncbi:MAG: penicillin acylase family protein [Deltaproteobacteria bacterium]
MKVLKWAASIFLSLVIMVCVAGYVWVKSTVPDYSGEITAPVRAPVKIVRDAYGVPYVLAESEEDGFVGVGLAMAQDRMFQMELIRRAAQGRLSEVLGPGLVETDKLFLALTALKSLEEHYRELSPELKLCMEAFSKGVNLFLETGPLPLEFRVLGFKPAPWRPADFLGVALIMAWDQSSAWSIDLTAAAVADKLGPEAARGFFPDYPQAGPTVVPEGGFMASGAADFMRAGLKARELFGAGAAGGSNAWVVSGEKSVTGAPILANDMHLDLSQPPIWWECGLIAGERKVKGVLVPGEPLALAGQSPHLAWGLSNVMADDADFFVEILNPDNPDEYLVGQSWEKVSKVTRTIPVKGGQPIEQTYRLTRNGVIINDLKTPAPIRGRVLAMRWAGQDNLGGAAETFYSLPLAKDWAGFSEAVARFGLPGQNFVYADKEGNIGWRMAFRVPRRKGGYNPVFPVEGHSGRYGWDGYEPYEAQPWLLNPSEGFIATANNKTIGPEYPHYISAYFANPDRITRIREMLTAKDKLSAEDMRTIQADFTSLAARRIRPLILAAWEGEEKTPVQAQALEMLRNWDLVLAPDSAPAAIFEMTYSQLFAETAADELSDLFRPWVKAYFVASMAMDRWLTQDAAIFDDQRTPETETRDQIIRRAMTKALDRLAQDTGEQDPAQWSWGRVHTVTFMHPFSGRSRLVDKVVNVGPCRVGGGLFTVNPTQYRLWADKAVVHGASMRHILDLSDPDRSSGSITTGQSGHFFSPHYGDQVALWLKVETHPLSLDPETIQNRAEYVLVLNAGPKAERADP